MKGNSQFSVFNAQLFLIIPVLSGLLLAVICLREYLSHQLFNLALGCLAMPFAIRIRPDKKGAYRFAVIAIFFTALSCYMPVYTLIYLALIATLLFLVESRYGQVNFLALIVAVLSMPISNYLLATFSFPIRLWLTSVCGHIFQLAQIPVEVAGNTISYANSDFSVDPACMGLNMLVTSLLVGVLLFGFYQKKYKKEMPVWTVLAYLVIILLLNIFSNLVRMMLLVMFQVFPDTLMHDIIGILCFLIQIVLPAWGICWFLIPRFKGREYQANHACERQVNPLPRGVIQLACCIMLWFAALQVVDTKEVTEIFVLDVPGYSSTPHSDGVLKLENGSSLVYLKKIRWFCGTEHNPMICWKGSGYTISKVQEVRSDRLTMYTGMLQKDDDILYTAWWYSNGQKLTNSQLHWRWDMFTGALPYSLVNVTTATKEALEEEVSKIVDLPLKYSYSAHEIN